MPNQPVGFTFREKMAGGFALGEADPEAGARAGQAAGSTFTMHGTIDIPDLDGFLSESTHPGSLTGQVDFPPLGSNLQSTSGIFQLFSPTTDPTMKYMVYELRFEAGGKSYYMAGRKQVQQTHVTDAWKATTTLYTQLHEGASKQGAVVGAGILTLGMRDLMDMIPTMHATNAQNPEEAAAAVARFGRFFLGELWDAYVKPTRL